MEKCVMCEILRSEIQGEMLKELGWKNVGGIFFEEAIFADL